jgi:hypothetical protein
MVTLENRLFMLFKKYCAILYICNTTIFMLGIILYNFTIIGRTAIHVVYMASVELRIYTVVKYMTCG